MSIFYRFYLYFRVCNEMATYSDPMEDAGNGRWIFTAPLRKFHELEGRLTNYHARKRRISFLLWKRFRQIRVGA
jgi:hypothetical protein